MIKQSVSTAHPLHETCEWKSPGCGWIDTRLPTDRVWHQSMEPPCRVLLESPGDGGPEQLCHPEGGAPQLTSTGPWQEAVTSRRVGRLSQNVLQCPHDSLPCLY